MRDTLVEPNMKKDEMLDVVRARAEAGTSEAEKRADRAEDKQKAKFRAAIEASTARILNIALTRGPADPEAA